MLGWLNKQQSKHSLKCVHLSQKGLHNFKTKTRAETSITDCDDTSNRTANRAAVIHFLLFYLFSAVFRRSRHKDDWVHSSPDNMCMTLQQKGTTDCRPCVFELLFLFLNCEIFSCLSKMSKCPPLPRGTDNHANWFLTCTVISWCLLDNHNSSGLWINHTFMCFRDLQCCMSSVCRLQGKVTSQCITIYSDEPTSPHPAVLTCWLQLCCFMCGCRQQ